MNAFLAAIIALLVSFPQPVDVALTGYTCEPVQANPMYPCGTPRWGGDPYAPGAACPVAWQGRVIAIEIDGEILIVECDDTPYHDELWIDDDLLPHVDARLPTLEAAWRLGFRRGSVWILQEADECKYVGWCDY